MGRENILSCMRFLEVLGIISVWNVLCSSALPDDGLKSLLQIKKDHVKDFSLLLSMCLSTIKLKV